jgi:chorismate mutase/prephenate dehydratase
MKRIQEVAEDEKKRFLEFLEHFNKNMMRNFNTYFDVDEDLSFALNAVKVFEKPTTLEEYRNYFEVIDNLIVDLIKMRMEKSRELAMLKKEMNIPVEVKDVEERKLNTLVRGTKHPVLMERIFTTIFQMSKAIQYETLKVNGLVGILGPAGSYSEEMALKLGAVKPILKYYSTIEDVFSAVYGREVKYGVVPIENSLTGSVMESVECLMKYDVFVVGEAELKISHCLVAKSNNISLKNIRYVYSHPQAVMQCMGFIRKYLPKAEIVYSTSTSQALEMLDDASVAISSETAARMMNYAIIKRDIQDSKETVTRFYVISADDLAEKRSVTSLFFSVKDRPGALKEVLEVFSKKGINLRKLESRPDKFRPGKYVFFTEAEADIDKETVEELKEKTEFFKILGRFDRVEGLKV